MKTRIVEYLGHGELVLPKLVDAGIAGNDRAKVRLAALQAAAHKARNPVSADVDLTGECRRVGLEPMPIQSLVQGAQFTPDRHLSAPGLNVLLQSLFADVGSMILPFANSQPDFARMARTRLDTLAAPFAAEADLLHEDQIGELIGVSADNDDSLHRLVMELHKKLNALAADCADEIFAGAHVRGLGPMDLPIVTTFMRGLESTRALKFDHPGLDTNVVRADGRVIIQNDIGTTDAHVIVVSVCGLQTEVRYTDVHRPRAEFFVSLFDSFTAKWSGLDERAVRGLAKDNAFFMVEGRHDARAPEQRDAFLEAVGAALVFLIDWNKARKRLQTLVKNSDAIAILTWGARHRYGHRAFLELGGCELVAAAARHAVPNRIGFGQRLDSVLGRDGARDFLQSVLKITSEGLSAGRAARIMHDVIEADLVRRLERTESTLLAVVVRQAGLAREIAARLDRHVAEIRAGRGTNAFALAVRAKYIEEKADRIAVDTRNTISTSEAAPSIGRLVDALEDAIDELEQAAFLASYLPEGVEATDWQPIGELCAAATAGAEAIASGVEAASMIQDGRRSDSDDAMATVGRLIDIEHAADTAERQVTGFVLQHAVDLRSGLAALEFARALERATDRLASVGHHLYAHVMAQLKP